MMKNYYYSAASNAFYPVTLRDDYERSGTWPTDGVPVDEDVFCEFACAPAPHGKTRVVGPDGLPAWGDIPPPSAEQVLADAMALRASLMAQATTAIAPLQDAADLKIATAAELQQLQAWKTYRVQLNRLASDAGFPASVSWPDQPA
ncbi:tail fiber assembly protein [Achromobacter xylosoxidans]